MTDITTRLRESEDNRAQTVAEFIAGMVGAPYSDWRHFTGEAKAVLGRIDAVSPWQPIETAPKDGTKMLRPHIHWGAMAVRHKRPEHTDEFTKGLNWMSVDYSSIWPDDAFLPFWMPLPATPSQIEEGKDNG